MKPIIIFGAGEIAELADFYFTHEAGRKVKAFMVDPAYLDGNVRFGRPFVSVDEAIANYPPSSYEAFVAISYQSMNRTREEKFKYLKSLGFTLSSYISQKATIYSTDIGENAFILEDNTIQPFVKIGSNVTLWSGNHIGHHSIIGSNTFISSHVVISGGVTVGENCFIGVNATIRDHVSLGPMTLVGAGALILDNTEAESVHMALNHTEIRRVKSGRLKSI